MSIQIGASVDYSRDGYSFRNGVVLTVNEARRGALVQWQAENGTHQAFCGAEYLTVTNEAALTTSVETISAA